MKFSLRLWSHEFPHVHEKHRPSGQTKAAIGLIYGILLGTNEGVLPKKLEIVLFNIVRVNLTENFDRVYGMKI